MRLPDREVLVANLGSHARRDMLMRFFVAPHPLDARIVYTKESDSWKGMVADKWRPKLIATQQSND